jgi:hypothetical protein
MHVILLITDIFPIFSTATNVFHCQISAFVFLTPVISFLSTDGKSVSVFLYVPSPSEGQE